MTALPLNNSAAKKLQPTSTGNIKPPAYLDGLVWREFGPRSGGLMLVTSTGGSQAVLTAAVQDRGKPAAIMTRDPKTARLRPIRADDAAARLLAAAPKMLAALIKTRDNLAGLSSSPDDIYAAMVRRLEAAIAEASPI